MNFSDEFGLCKEEKSLSSFFTKTISNVFSNDKKADIYTLGLSISGTISPSSAALGTGLYINPKNTNTLLLSVIATSSPNPALKALGLFSLINNVDDVGGYLELAAGTGAGVSASGGLSVGHLNSVNDARGPYIESGGSKTIMDVSLGADLVKNMELQTIGQTISVGGGVGSSELHIRGGITGITSFVEK